MHINKLFCFVKSLPSLELFDVCIKILIISFLCENSHFKHEHKMTIAKIFVLHNNKKSEKQKYLSLYT